MSKIGWTDRTWPDRTVVRFTEANGRARATVYQRKRTDRPGTKERREKAALGLRWCRGCRDWLPSVDVSKQGTCQPCANAEYRQRYAADGAAIRARVYARKRALAPIPEDWAAARMEAFGGLCAYGCGRTATTQDHIVPVAAGGLSEPANLVPACRRCNSQKRHSDPWPWIDRGVQAFPDEWTDILALALEWSLSGLEHSHG